MKSRNNQNQQIFNVNNYGKGKDKERENREEHYPHSYNRVAHRQRIRNDKGFPTFEGGGRETKTSIMSTSVNIFRNTISSSSSGGGKEEQTKSVTITENGTTTVTPDYGKVLSSVEVNTEVSPIGKAVWYLGEHDVMWNEKQGELQPNDKVAYSFDSDELWLISVTSDGETPREDKTNVIFSSETKINNEFRVDFRAEINNNVYDSYVDVHSSAPR